MRSRSHQQTQSLCCSKCNLFHSIPNNNFSWTNSIFNQDHHQLNINYNPKRAFNGANGFDYLELLLAILIFIIIIILMRWSSDCNLFGFTPICYLLVRVLIQYSIKIILNLLVTYKFNCST